MPRGLPRVLRVSGGPTGSPEVTPAPALVDGTLVGELARAGVLPQPSARGHPPSSPQLAVVGREVRGSKLDYLHCSEVASWTAGGEDYLLGLLNCVVQGFETEAVIESTAQGVGGVFHDMYWDAAEGNSGWESVFFPWYIYSHYRKPFNSEEEKEKFKSELGQDKRDGGESEQSLLGRSVNMM